MANCTMCTKFDECPWRNDPNGYCSAYEQRAMTNADRIRAMTDEELAKHFSIYCWSDNWCGHHRDCEACWLDWLKQEAPDG